MNLGTRRSKTAHFRSFRPASLAHARVNYFIALFFAFTAFTHFLFLAITAPPPPAFGIFPKFAFTHKSLSMSDLQGAVKE